MGAGIEIAIQPKWICWDLKVAPLVGAGIEMSVGTDIAIQPLVAPLVGAGIEMILTPVRPSIQSVAPLVGAGIEIIVAVAVVG